MNEHWEQTLNTIKSELSPHVYNTWIRPLHYRSIDEEKVLIEVPNSFYKEKIQKDFSKLLLSHLRQKTKNQNVQLSFILSEKDTTPIVQSPIPEKKPVAKKDPFLSPKYSFETFIVGNNNQFAHAAAKAVAESPGQIYNPLFIYGGVGLGKTHLISAIGNEVARQNPSAKIVYRPSEQFTNEVIYSIRFEKMQAFRSQYRKTCDVLLLDDIHFLSGKERTQEEFFHTFNALQRDGKQIILTSDRMPAEIPDLDERLRSRFQSGLFCDIQKPDLETRVAILRRRADQTGLVIDDKVLFLIAEKVDSNVRVLEGSLNQLVARASLIQCPIDENLANQVLSSMATQEKPILVEDILKTVASFFHIKVSDLKSSRKHKVIAQPRQIAMYLSRKFTQLSFPELGEKFGGKDHTTIMHGCTKIQKEMEKNAQLRSTLSALEKNIHH